MQTAASINRVFTGVSSGCTVSGAGSGAGSLQQIFLSKLVHASNSYSAFSELADLATRLAERAYSLRDIEALQEISLVLVNLPVPGAREAGLYYQAIVYKRTGLADKARSLLEAVSSTESARYRARSIQSLGAISQDTGDLAEALRFHSEALRAALNAKNNEQLTTLMALLDISKVQSLMGDHETALRTLEEIPTLVSFVAKWHPLYFYFYHNELAVELGELGRIEEAMAACAVALRFPFAFAYPEWSETRRELEAKRSLSTRSIVTVNPLPTNLRTSISSHRPDHRNAVHTKAEHVRAYKPLVLVTWLVRSTTWLVTHCSGIARTEFRTSQFIRGRLGECCQSRAPPPLAKAK